MRRVALVSITDDVLLVGVVFAGNFPFHASGETAAAASAQPRLLDDVDGCGGVVVGQHIAKGGVAIAGDVLLNVLGVDETAVAQSYTDLLLVEVHVLGVAHVLFLLGVEIEQAVHLAPFDNVLFNNFCGVGGGNLGVESVVGDYLNDGTFLAEAEAASFYYLYLVFEVIGLQLGLEFVNNL